MRVDEIVRAELDEHHVCARLREHIARKALYARAAEQLCRADDAVGHQPVALDGGLRPDIHENRRLDGSVDRFHFRAFCAAIFV